ncbi:MAG: glycosyltransferase family 4 protein [Candidatus Aceula meridiana]|nr:glycosyltransferase family 4 protein [Candidatus Aceula meridiana]
MKILQINKFFYLKGGPERYMFNVSELLKSKGHEIAFFSMEHEDNKPCEWSKYFIKNINYAKKHGIAEQFYILKNTLCSREAESKISQLIYNFKPDIAHVHNFNHQLTPSILFALRRKNIPIVMTMHDYKLVCPSYSMLNHGKICELCKGKRFYHCATTKCHKNSFTKSLLASLESYFHHQILSSYRPIKRFICPSKFIMNKMQEMGLAGHFVYLPNFTDISHFKPSGFSRNKKFTYWGRLSTEKGVITLLRAFENLSADLEIIGEGPLRGKIEEEIKIKKIKNIKLLGYLKGNVLFDKIGSSFAAIMPSECYENNPISVLEAFALRLPVIGSRIGGIPELVINGETGLLFEPGKVGDLREKIKYSLDNPDKLKQFSKNAYDLNKKRFNEQLHYDSLIKVYNDAAKN